MGKPYQPRHLKSKIQLSNAIKKARNLKKSKNQLSSGNKGGCYKQCQKSNARVRFVCQYHVAYFFKTLIRRNPDSCTGYDIYLIDRLLYRVVPLTYSTQRIASFQKFFIFIQVIWAAYTEWRCYMFHIASLKWIHDTLFTLWEFILWVQFPIYIFMYILSSRFKTDDNSWLHMVRVIVWFLLFLTLLVIIMSLIFVSDFPLGLMEDAWQRDREYLHKPDRRPGWVMNMQRPLECCGFREPNDWLQGKHTLFSLPYTCCPITTYFHNCSLQFSFHEGCLWRVKTLYVTCKPVMWQGAAVNVIFLIINYGFFRYLFKRNYQGWQVDMTWHEALLPVLKVQSTKLPLKLKKEPKKLKRLTESEAVLDILSQVSK